MRKTLAIAVVATAVTFITAAASASTLSLDAVLTPHGYQQTSNRPCVIGDNSCTYVTAVSPDADAVISPSSGAVDMTSARFYVSTIRALFGGTGDSFKVGFDVNQSSVAQTIQFFGMYVNGNLIDSFGTIGGSNTLVPPTVGGGNGNGYADYLFTGFTSLSGYLGTDIVTFREIMPATDDGLEEFFLIADLDPVQQCTGDLCDSAVPEPTTLVLFGTGLVGVGVALRRRKAKA